MIAVGSFQNLRENYFHSRLLWPTKFVSYILDLPLSCYKSLKFQRSYWSFGKKNSVLKPVWLWQLMRHDKSCPQAKLALLKFLIVRLTSREGTRSNLVLHHFGYGDKNRVWNTDWSHSSKEKQCKVCIVYSSLCDGSNMKTIKAVEVKTTVHV